MTINLTKSVSLLEQQLLIDGYERTHVTMKLFRDLEDALVSADILDVSESDDVDAEEENTTRGATNSAS